MSTLFVATSLYYTDLALSKLNNSVYLYDPRWNPTYLKDDIDTLPVVYLEVIKENIRHTTTASKKRIILFNKTRVPKSETNTGETVDSNTDSVINSIVDNAVNEPVVHVLECLVPRDAINKGFMTFMATSDSVLSFMETMVDRTITVDIAGAGTQSQATFNLSNAVTTLRAILTSLNQAKNLIDRAIAVYNKFRGVGSDFGRRSLQAMHRKRALLKYKAWNSWETKDVIITNFEISKVGTEDDYFRATIELQEMPILFVGTIPPGTQKAGVPNAYLRKAVKKAFEGILQITTNVSNDRKQLL